MGEAAESTAFVEDRVQPLTEAAVQYILTNIRGIDREEVYHTRGWFDAERMKDIIMGYPGFGVVYWDDHGFPVAMCGVRDIFPHRLGVAWLLATPQVKPHLGGLSRRIRRFLRAHLDVHPELTLQAYSWERHPMSGRWLEWIGFEEATRTRLSTDEQFVVYAMRKR